MGAPAPRETAQSRAPQWRGPGRGSAQPGMAARRSRQLSNPFGEPTTTQDMNTATPTIWPKLELPLRYLRRAATLYLALFTLLPAQAQMPDLQPLTNGVTVALTGRVFTVSRVIVTNQGAGAATGAWSNAWCWSTTTNWSTNYPTLTNITWSQTVPASNSYALSTVLLSAPTNAKGPCYLVLWVNRTNAPSESNTNNNCLALPVTSIPDLEPLSVETTNLAAAAGESFKVVTTVTNRGAGVAAGNWTDSLYLSTNQVWGPDALALTNRNRTQPVPAYSVYRATNQVTMPAQSNWTSGRWYLINRVNETNGLYELNISNNSAIAFISLTVPDLNLTQVSALWPVSNRTVSVVHEVKVDGDGDAQGAWYDQWYWSTNGTTTNQVLLTVNNQTRWASGLSYWRTNLLTLPPGAVGTNHLILRLNDGRTLYERSMNNNSLVLTLTNLPDITPVDFIFTNAVAGQGLTFETVVTNQGRGLAVGSWSNAVFFSTKTNLDETAIHLGNYLWNRTITNGSEVARQTNSIILPRLPGGNYNLFVWVNASNQLYELRTNNNVLRRSVRLTVPDLLPVRLDWTNAVSGRPLSVATVVTNRGTGVAAGTWTDSLFLHTNATWDATARWLANRAWTATPTNGAIFQSTMVFTLPPWPAGNNYHLIFRVNTNSSLYEASETNNTLTVPITLTVPDLAPVPEGCAVTVVSNRNLLVVSTVTNRGTGDALTNGVPWTNAWFWSTNVTPFATSIAAANVPAGSTYRTTNLLTLPLGTVGTNLFTLRINHSNALYESNLGNNELSLAVTNVPDAQPLEMAVLGRAVAGKPVGVVLTLTNNGTATAAGRWTNAWYLARGPHWDTNAVWLTNATWNSALPVESSVVVTNAVPLSQWPRGAYYLIMRTDAANQLYELNDANNEMSIPVELTIPDLVAGWLNWPDFDPPQAPEPGFPITMKWTVSNKGNGEALPVWYDTIYLSTNNAFWEASDRALLEMASTKALAPNATMEVTASVTIPTNTPASYYLIVKANSRTNLFEETQTNNWRAFGVGEYRDADADGIPDAWERLYFGHPFVCDPNADPDHDGMTNWQEHQADTNPTNALSLLRFTSVVPQTNGVRITWQGGINSWQILERSASVGPGGAVWTTIFSTNRPTPLENSLLDTEATTNSMKLYRLKAGRN